MSTLENLRDFIQSSYIHTNYQSHIADTLFNKHYLHKETLLIEDFYFFMYEDEYYGNIKSQISIGFKF